MALIGYARVSTLEQTTALQLAAFRRAGVARVIEEKASALKHRPALESLLASMVAGDVLVVYKLDRLARSMGHFVRVFETLKGRAIGFRSLTEAIETETAQGRMFLHMLSAFAEFERELIRERCLAGQKAARARGQRWGRVPAIDPHEGLKVAALWRSGWFTQQLLAEILGVHVAVLRDTIHRAEKRGRWALRK